MMLEKNKIKNTRILSIVIAMLFTTISSYAQIHKASCIISYKLNILTSGVLQNNSDNKYIQNNWDETVYKLQQELSSISTKNKKFEIKNDTLHMADKISVKRKVHYNISKFPLQKLVNVTTSFKELIIYTKWKEIVVERYQYKKLHTSQITILKRLKKGEHTKLIALFKQLKIMNSNRE